MKAAGLFFFAGLVAAFAQKLDKPKVHQPVVCIKKEKTLDLTLVQGKDGNTGLPGLKGSYGERGPFGDTGKLKGQPGLDGLNGKQGRDGEKGDEGVPGRKGEKGVSGNVGQMGESGEYGEPGDYGPPGPLGCPGEKGLEGDKGDRGPHGFPVVEDIKDLLVHALNDYQVTESGYYNRFYHVTSRDLTDGRTDTGGWGSATGKTGNYIQATFLRPVYVTSVTVAGGYIPSWTTRTTRNGKLKLEYSTDGKNWKTGTTTFRTPVGQRMVTIKFQPITAQYWRLISTENKWVGTTEFALKPLIKP